MILSCPQAKSTQFSRTPPETIGLLDEPRYATEKTRRALRTLMKLANPEGWGELQRVVTPERHPIGTDRHRL